MGQVTGAHASLSISYSGVHQEKTTPILMLSWACAHAPQSCPGVSDLRHMATWDRQPDRLSATGWVGERRATSSMGIKLPGVGGTCEGL